MRYAYAWVPSVDVIILKFRRGAVRYESAGLTGVSKKARAHD